RAMSNRGKVLWLPYDSSLRAPHLESFFDRLQRSTGRKLFALLSGMQWQRAATFSAWASRRTEQLQLFHLPEASDMLSGAHALAEDMRQPPRPADATNANATSDTSAAAPPDNPMLFMLQRMLKLQLAHKAENQPRYAERRQQQKSKENAMTLTHLQRLEAESIQAMREVVA